MRFALVQPPTPYLVTSKSYGPLGLGYLAAYVRQELPWLEVQIVDFSTERNPQAAMLGVLPRQDVCGWTATSLDYETARGMARRVTQLDSDVVHLLGGAHATALPDQVDMDVFTSVICGEGELALTRCLLDIGHDRQPRRVYASAAIEDLDTLPFPDRLKPEAKQVQGGEGQSATIMCSRGCAHQCAFCATQCMWPGGVRFRSPGNVAAEVEELVEQGVTDFAFIDDSLTLSKPWLTKLCDLLKPLKIRWRALSRVDRATSETLRMMSWAGCTEICYGVESFDQNVLDALRKGTTIAQAKKAILAAAGAGLTTRVFLMISTPGESYRMTVERNKRSLEDLGKAVGMVSLSTFMPLPGTPIWMKPEDYGIEIAEPDLSKMNRYWYRPHGENKPWSPIRIDGMTYTEQLENISEMRHVLSALDRANTGVPR